SAAMASGPACARVSRPAAASPSRSLAKPSVSAIAAWSGRCSRHSASSDSTSDPAASTEARIRCGCRAITSRAEVPMEPVAPRTATERGAFIATGPSEPEPDLAHREHGQARHNAIDAIQQAAVAGDEVARILHPGVALDHAFKEV